MVAVCRDSAGRQELAGLAASEGFQVAIQLPAGDLHPVLVPLLGLGLDEALIDVLAERFADDRVALQLLEGVA